MRRTDAPPPGWYPDPTGRSGLLWWDGLDWTHHHRPEPARPAPDHASVGDTPTEHGAPSAAVPSATQLRSRASETRRQQRQHEQEVAEAVAEARRVARSEVDRAVSQATRQLTRARDEWQPRLDRAWRRVKRWTRVVVVVVVLFVALSTWASATLQTSLLEWLGERIDAATASVAPRTDWSP